MAAPAAVAAPGGKEGLPDLMKSILYPKALPSLRETMPTGHIQIMLYKARGQPPTELTLVNMFPFMTLQDIKLALYNELKRDDSAIPEFVYLATHGAEAGKTYVGGRTAPVDFSWNLPGLSAAAPFLNAAPFEIVAGAIPPDSRFVDSTGQRRILAPIQRERLTIEDAFFKRGIGAAARKLPVLHAYLYKDLVVALEGPSPPSEAAWNGRIAPFFPHLTMETANEVEEFRTRAARLSSIFTRRQQFLVKLESILDENLPLIPLTLAGLRFLRLTWDKKKDIPGIEAQFYEAAVNERRPFMRLIPTEGTGISKVFLKDGKTPDIHDPQLIVNWSQERSPTPEQDFAFAKILVRRGLSSVPPIYATLRLFNDGSADAIVEPPRGVKKLDPRTDLAEYGEVLLEGLADLPYLSSLPDIGNAAIVLGVKLRRDATQALSARIIRQRLPVFQAFFQEIAPLTGEKPLIMLRFKLVSNFATEDRVETFITQVMNRKLLKGEGVTSELVELVADEFQLDMKDARQRVAKKLQTMGEVALVVPETKDYVLQYNPGIDVAVYAQHPFYTFHLYRVDSSANLQRIITALSLMISAEPEDLVVSVKAAKELATAELAEASAASAAAAAEAEDEELAFENVGEEEVAAVLAQPAAGPVTEPAAEVVAEAEDVGGADEVPNYFDDFAFDDDGDQYSPEEQEALAAAAEAAKKEGTPYPEPPLPAAEVAAPPPTAAATVPVAELRKTIAEGVVKPKEELTGVAVAPAAAAAVPAADDEEDEGAAAGTAPSTKSGVAQFFIQKLNEADSRLFSYNKTHPSLKKYVSMCQPNYGRQPAVLSEEKFQAMREEYEKDGIEFYVYPLADDEPTKPTGIVEKDYFTVLRYGTDPKNQNYYLCCRYFCTRDEILILEKDFDGVDMRRPKGGKKLPGECPFCRGRLIENKRLPRANETILERATARGSTRRHLYISFPDKTTPHPEGFYLPCCFLNEDPVRFRGPAFDKYREWGVAPKAAEARPSGPMGEAMLEEEEEEGEGAGAGAAGPRGEAGYPILDYYVTMAGVTRKYIVGAEKLPLEVGTVAREKGKEMRGEPQIGLLPTVLDSFFDQDTTQLVSRTSNPQKIKPGGSGFLRIGVENRLRNQADSLLSAIAPFFLKNTARQMKDLLLERIQPRVFLALNYGNFALEFYDPTNIVMEKGLLTQEALREWASDNLEVDLAQENEAAIRRARISYETFKLWVESTEKKKEYRHLALLFAQSSLMRRPGRPGITFIVVDILKSGKVDVRCPPFGYNADIMAKNDVGFLLHHWSGVWEPIFYVDNRAPEERGIDIFTLLFQYGTVAQWPPIVSKRLQEFISQCSSVARGVYTSQSKINALSMIPASVAKRVLSKDPRVSFEGVVRDSYNHLAALVFKEKAAATGGFIPLPVADDGELIFQKQFFMDWDDPAFQRAPVDQVLKFYKTYINDRFKAYPGFSPVRIVKDRRADIIEAVQLRNGLYVPCAPPSSEEATTALTGTPTVSVDQMEWAINHEICLNETEAELPGEKERMDILEFQEIFEHLRLTFSNWFATVSDSGEFRSQIEEIVLNRRTPRLPLYERRKRLEMILSRTVAKWITTDFADEDEERNKEVSLLRVDCRLKDEGGCGGRCVWRQEPGDPKKGRCLLHVAEETKLGESDAALSAPRVLLLRLIEELLRYGERSRQLLHQDVSRLAAFEKPITIEIPGKVGKQRIYPEKSTAWFELLRLDWAKRPDEKPVYTEEMSRAAASADMTAEGEGAEGLAAAPALAEEGPDTSVPPTLQTILNGPAAAGDPKTGGLRLLRIPLEAILTMLGITPAQLGVKEGDTAFTAEMVRELTRMTGRAFVQIDIRADPPAVLANKPFRVTYPGIPVVVVTAEGSALLLQNPAAPSFLKKEDMPVGLADIATKAKGVLGIRPAAAAAAPKPAA